MQNLMSLIRLILSKWVTNSQRLKDTWQEKSMGFKTVTNVLDDMWNTEKATFHLSVTNTTQHLLEPVTKRSFLILLPKFMALWDS
ncbi:hypothetical protein NPIL_363471 [Nephila pilipes]|uniref:Uncharacterized protein n=1 Tax=Nephila pilipes TaxID=299642 RepID=A0A8X6NJL3_NEPPI|nr:hypothetical protein NPIL_363471 [Nephila pilipes]